MNTSISSLPKAGTLVRRMSRRAAITAAAAATFLMTPLAQAEVTDVVPQDALVVFKVNNVGQVNQDIATLARAWGLAEMQPAMNDPFGMLQQQMGIEEGLNAEGDFAMYMLAQAPGAEGGEMGGDEPAFVLLFPVSDYQAFLGNFEGVQTEGAVSTVQMPEGDEPGYVAQWGDYAAMSPIRQLVQTKPEQTISTAGLTGERFDERDLVIYANMGQIASIASPKLQEARGEAATELQEEMQNNPEAAKFAPVAEEAMNQAFRLAEMFLSDTQAATLSFSFEEDGVGIGLVSQFKEDSYLANTLGNLESTGEPLLAGLPEGRYFVYGGSNFDSETIVRLYEDLVPPIQAKLNEVGGQEAELVGQYLDAVKTTLQNTNGQTFGLFAPEGQPGQAALLQYATIINGNPAQLKQAMQTMTQVQPQLMQLLPAEMQQAQGGGTSTYVQNTKTVNDVQFDAIQTELPPEAQQQAAMIFGPEGPTTLIGTVGDDKLVQAMGLSDTQLASVIEAARAGNAPLAQLQGVQMVNGKLPQERYAVMYIALDEMVRTGADYARAFGMGANIMIPPELPPIGVAVASQQQSLTVDGYVPSELVQSLVAAYFQVQRQMQNQGANPGGPGGL